jgi:phosphate starvation-inducible PhoH-like protein
MIIKKYLLLCLPLLLSNFSLQNGLVNYGKLSQYNSVRFLNMKKDRPKNIVNFYLPKTYNQQTYLDALNNDKSKIVVVSGPAGTGKTMFACLKAIDLLKNNVINKIVVTRPVVTVEEDIGFLPGNIVKKMDPWTKPVFDLFLEKYSKSELDNLIYTNTIEICPLAFMRGRTFKSAFIIADEMQNSSPNQMKMLTTRLGTNSKMVITGDVKQSDMTKENGLTDFINKIKLYEKTSSLNELIDVVELSNTDIERSEVVRKVINIYDIKEMD